MAFVGSRLKKLSAHSSLRAQTTILYGPRLSTIHTLHQPMILVTYQVVRVLAAHSNRWQTMAIKVAKNQESRTQIHNLDRSQANLCNNFFTTVKYADSCCSLQECFQTSKWSLGKTKPACHHLIPWYVFRYVTAMQVAMHKPLFNRTLQI